MIPFRKAELFFDSVAGVNRVRSLKVMVMQECIVNQDFESECLHPAPARASIDVDEIPVKGGPACSLDKPVDDVLEFVEGKMRQGTLVSATSGSNHLLVAVLIAAVVSVFVAITVLRSKKLVLDPLRSRSMKIANDQIRSKKVARLC